MNLKWGILLLASFFLQPTTLIGAKANFDRSKPHVNIGTIGHVDHGKTTLTAAITTVLEKDGMAVRTFREIETSSPAKKPRIDIRGLLNRVCEANYETEPRHYAHVDCPGHADYVKRIIAGDILMDGAIMYVSALDGPMPQTREHILLARQIGVPAIVTFVDEIDLVSDEVLERIEFEIRELLRSYGFDPGSPIIMGNLLGAVSGNRRDEGAIRSLTQAMDDWIPLPTPNDELPFRLSISHTQAAPRGGLIVAGKVESGTFAENDILEIVGSTPPDPPFISPLLVAPANRATLSTDDHALLYIQQDRTNEWIETGQVLASPGSLSSRQRFEARVHVDRFVLDEKTGSHPVPFFNGYRPQFYFRTTDVTGSVELPKGREMVMPGDNVTLTVNLIRSVAVEPGLRFAIRDKSNGRQVAIGVVTHPSP